MDFVNLPRIVVRACRRRLQHHSAARGLNLARDTDMMFDWFNGRDAAHIGVVLADQFAPGMAAPGTASGTASGTAANGTKSGRKEHGGALRELLERADRDVRALRLNFYKKARFANSFKWRLIENGVDAQVANEVTQSLILHLSQDEAGAAAGSADESAPAAQPAISKVNQLLKQANKAFADGDYEEAIARYDEYVQLAPRDAGAFNNLGVALSRLRRYHEAEQRYRQAIELNPEFAEALTNLATLMQGSPPEAEQWLRRALKANPRYVEARAKLGMALAFSGRSHEAKACFKKALKNAPNHAEALLGLGQIARTEGQFAEAESYIKRALKINPRMPNAYAALNSIRTMTVADGDWLKGAEEIADSGISLWEEAELRFAIGKYADDVDDFDRAFQNYRRGNELLKSMAQRYDRDAHSRFADDMIRGHSREALAAVGDGASPSQKPIFVVGMPRSGTSLAEQIIASHPKAQGAGELEFWLDAARANHAELRQGILGLPLRKQLAEEYLRVLAQHCPEASRVVDKTTINSDYLGLLYSVFPNGRIIHMQRDPIDTCLSCYFQQFSTAQRFTMDLADLADYYRVHQRLMKHWHAALPGRAILTVPYEELVADQEGWTHKILDFLELEWDERCLDFHRTKRTVNTASAWQVRQKIYNKSVGRWHHYEKYLGPLKALRA